MAKKTKKEFTKSDWFIIVIPVIIIVVLIGGVLGIKYFYKPKTEIQTIEFNGFTFVNDSNIWKTQIQMQNNVYNLMFKYNPYDIEDIRINYHFN